jgi:hypothetical protein
VFEGVGKLVVKKKNPGKKWVLIWENVHIDKKFLRSGNQSNLSDTLTLYIFFFILLKFWDNRKL